MQTLQADERPLSLPVSTGLSGTEALAVSPFFVLLLVAGVIVLDDYGATYDEGYCMARNIRPRTPWG